LIIEQAAVEDLVEAADNDEIQDESDDFVDFTVIDPFSEGGI
jgi:hypothetical protein